MSVALRVRYRAWYFSRRHTSDELEDPGFVGFPFRTWHRIRVRRMYGVQF